MTNPTDLPGRSIPVLTLHEAPQAQPPAPSAAAARAAEREAFQNDMAARRKNESDYEVTCNILGLPTAEHSAEADAVRVCSADIDVLAAWWFEKRGTVTFEELAHGVTVWVLDTTAGVDEGYSGCRVLVTVVLASSAWVTPELRDAAQVSA